MADQSSVCTEQRRVGAGLYRDKDLQSKMPIMEILGLMKI